MDINSILKNLIKNFNTFLDCPVRFSGEHDGEKVHHFIEYIESFKRIKCITDEQALLELQYLLLDQAHNWWLRRKANLTTWSEALTSLENHYSKQRPSHIIYKEIFKKSYDDYNAKEDFVDDKNELFNELPQPKLTETNKLEMIYALLPNDIQANVKFVNISSLKDLKEQLKIVKCSNTNSIVDINNADREVITETIVNEKSHKEQPKQSENPDTSAGENEEENNINLDANDRDPIIKVRRTEDLMPHIKDEGEQNISQQEEFIANDVHSENNNSTAHNNNENFQIDSDIMNQINNIIDESEMNMETQHHNQQISSIISGRPDNVPVLAFLLNGENTIQHRLLTHLRPHENQKRVTMAMKKGKIRCSFCRRYNHTSQTCLKKAKQMKLFPEKFMTPKPRRFSDGPQPSLNETDGELLTSNNNTNTTTSTNPTLSPINVTNNVPIPSSSSLTVPTVTTVTSSLNNTPSITVPIVATVTSSFNNIPEKNINPSSLTTKLIAPINGPAPNKILAAKLRNINVPMPKCHQCGTVGFYKSICPNCSPIYNNNTGRQNR